MGFLTGLSNRVKDFLSQDKESQAKRLAKGATTAGALVGYGKDMLQVFGYDSIAAYLNIENDLLSRFADYEEMDESPEISATSNIYADEATQNDYERKKPVWVVSSDKTIETLLDNDLLRKRLRMGDEEIWEIARTLVKYGNDYEEMLVDNTGVVGLNYLPPATVRRIEGPRGELFGFVQDYRGRYGYTPYDFQALIKQRFQTNPSGLNPKDDHIPGSFGNWERPGRSRAVAFEDWEIVHFRLRGKARRSIYGHCLSADSRVWTDSGIKFIADIEIGDRVLTRHAGMLRTTTVLDKVCNGVKQLYKIKTTHREIRATAEHPLLVDHGGKNNAWVEVKDLQTGDHLIATCSAPVFDGPPPLGLHLLGIEETAEVRLTERGQQALMTKQRPTKYASRDAGLQASAKNVGLSRGQLHDLLHNNGVCKFSELSSLFKGVGLALFEGSFSFDRPLDLKLPDFVEAWFARLWGFMLGDGWLRENSVHLALGEYPHLNKHYCDLLARTGLEIHIVKDEKDIPTSACVYSKALVEVFAKLGWINGVRNKRVPQWAFVCPIDLRKELVRGFFDADGWSTRGGAYQHAELCNDDLLADIKTVIDGIGWTSGLVRKRDRSHVEKVIKGKKTRSSASYLLFFHETPLSEGTDFCSEEILSIEVDTEEPVWDIAVADSGHCFVADGLVVHNSALESARWIWKRLQLLEDAALIYRLQRAPERYAFYVDVGDLPPAEALHYVNRVKQQYKKKKFFDPCLTGDTLLNCLDGQPRSLKEMAREGGEYWVYSFDLATGEVVPGKAKNARKTGKRNPVFRVILDNGSVVRATGDHPFLMRDGTYKDCCKLESGDRLMPLNLAQVRKGNDAGYVRIRQPSTGYFESVHQMVARNLWPKKSKKGNVVHHRDGVKNNNCPENLEVMTGRQHALEHLDSNLNKARVAYVARVRQDSDFKEEIASRLAAWRSRDPDLVRSVCSAAGVVSMARRSEEAEPLQLKIEDLLKRYLERDPLLTAEQLVQDVNKDPEFLGLYAALPTTQRPIWGYNTFHTWVRRRGYAGYKAFKEHIVETRQSRQRKYNEKDKSTGNNHKVVMVQFDGYEDVYNVDVEKYANFGLVSGIFVHNSTGKLNLRWEPLPVAYDTPIPLLDGRTISIEKMTEEFAAGQKHWVYSVDRKTGHSVPGEVEWVGKTRSSAPAVKLTFDDGGHITMAPDHPVMRRDYSYVNAQDLKPGDSVMPFYRKISSKAKGDLLEGYEKIYDPKWQKYRYTHSVVAVDQFGDREDGFVIHHKDFRKLNNEPGNLCPMRKEDHGRLHAALGHVAGAATARKRKTDLVLDAKLRAASSRNILAFNRSDARSLLSSDINRRRNQAAIVARYNNSQEHSRANPKRSRLKKAMWADPIRRARAQANMRIKFPQEWLPIAEQYVRTASRPTMTLLVDLFNSKESTSELEALNPGRKISGVHRHMLLSWLRENGFQDFIDFKQSVLPANNHKVVSVEFVAPRDHYCMTVRRWHNFSALLRDTQGDVLDNSGIVVKNTQDDDFFVPVRKGQEGARIEVLGAPAWQHMEDIEYFRDKMFAALQVPKSYLSQERGVPRQILSNQDVAFARTILRVQRELRNGVSRICRIHLMALGIDPYRIEYNVHMATPSSIYELAQIEVMNARADLATRMQAFVSEYWILNKIFGIQDEDIELIMKQKEEDQERFAQQQLRSQDQMNAQQLKFSEQMGQQQIGHQVQGGMAMQQAGLVPPPMPPQAAAPRNTARTGPKKKGSTKTSEAIESFVRHLADGGDRGNFGTFSASMLRERYSSANYESAIMRGDRQAEKAAEAKLDRVLANDRELATRLDQLGSLLNELRSTHRSGRGGKLTGSS